MSVAIPGNEDKVRGISAYDMARLLGELFGSHGFVALEKANEHNIAVLAATDILATVMTPTSPPCLFRVAVAVDTAGIFSAMITKGGNTQEVQFNAGTNLTLNALYFFDMLVHLGDTVNLRHSVGAQLLVLRVQEIDAAVQ